MGGVIFEFGESSRLHRLESLLAWSLEQFLEHHQFIIRPAWGAFHPFPLSML